VQGGYPFSNDAEAFLDSDPGPVGFDNGDAYQETFSNPYFDIDVPLSTIHVFAAQQHVRPAPNTDPTICLPDSIFSKLSQDDKHTWSRLSGDACPLPILSWVTLVLATLLFTLDLLSPVTTPSTQHPAPSTGLSNVNHHVHMSEHTPLPVLTPDALALPPAATPPHYAAAHDDPLDTG
jgi:hypothetical protein